MPNTNCLEGIKCPACGNEDVFTVAATVWVDVTDDGAELNAIDSSVDLDDTSEAVCGKCGYNNIWSSFCSSSHIPGNFLIDAFRADSLIDAFHADAVPEIEDVECSECEYSLPQCECNGEEN